jgi:hypothetical protein
MGYYPKTIARVRFLVGQKYPGIEPTADLADKPAYILWMLEQVEGMKDDPTKAARWIGYVVRMAEELDLLANSQSRELCRMDVQDGAI